MMRIERCEGRCLIQMNITPVGRDLHVCLSGGDVQHIGAVALAVPRPSLSDPARTSASASVLTVTGHKEDELARSVALALASAARCVVCVSCGIHMDEAGPEEIDLVQQQVRDMLGEATKAFAAS